MLLFQGAGGRIPDKGGDHRGHRRLLNEPLAEQVWPLWTGQAPSPSWQYGEQFCQNLVSLRLSDRLNRLAPRRRFIQFLPLILAQALAVVGLWRYGTALEVHEPEEP